MATAKDYLSDLLKTKTLDEIAAQTSVSKKILIKILQGQIVHVPHPVFKRILNMWLKEVYLK